MRLRPSLDHASLDHDRPRTAPTNAPGRRSSVPAIEDGELNRLRRSALAAVCVVAVAVVAAFAAAGFSYGVERLLGEVVDGPTWVVLTMPAVGLVTNALVRHLAGRRAGPATVDAYINAYHGGPVDVRANAARLAGGGASVGLGAALDPAGPAVLLGTSIGHLGRRCFHMVGPDLLVAGAAAGLGAALHTPVAGAVLAIELPFRDGAGWRRLPYALAGSVAGFVARGIIDEFTIPFRTDIGVVGVRDVLLALTLAFLAGFASRIVAWLAHRAQTGLGPTFGREWQHVFSGAAALVALAAISLVAFDDVPVTLGPGRLALEWSASDVRVTAAGLGALFLVCALANGASMLGRGTGGLLLPLLVLGFVAGHGLGDAFDGNVGLLTIIGAATLLGAGYRVPAAALVWIAESTHSVPAILLGGVAVLIAASVGGGRSVSTAQRSTAQRSTAQMSTEPTSTEPTSTEPRSSGPRSAA